jgi:hypothetical protein
MTGAHTPRLECNCGSRSAREESSSTLSVIGKATYSIIQCIVPSMQRREFFVSAAATPIVGFPDLEAAEGDSTKLPESDYPMIWFGLLSMAIKAPVDEEDALEATNYIRYDGEMEEAIRRVSRDEIGEEKLIERFVATSDWVDHE